MATMKTLNGYGFNATELNGKTSDSYLQLGDDGTGSTGEAPKINAGMFGGMTVSQFVDMIYPVGSIYMSVNSTSPETLFGGTWESIGGRFLLGADATYAAGSTGGEATHKLTVSELPVLSGSISMHGEGAGGSVVAGVSGVFSAATVEQGYQSSAVNSGAPSVSRIEFHVGSGQRHNNLPPYLAVYMWKRTA